MRQFILLCLLLCAAEIQSQLIIDNTDLPNTGILYTMAVDTQVSISIAAGSSTAQAWNFSSLDSLFPRFPMFYPSALNPHSATYPTSNLFTFGPSYLFPNLAGAAPTHVPAYGFMFFASNTQGHSAVGFKGVDADSIDVVYDDPELLLPTGGYGTVVYDTVRWVYPFDKNPADEDTLFVRTVYKRFTYDAFGSLQLPSTSYADVARVQEQYITIDTIVVEVSGTPVFSYEFDRYARRKYIYVADNQEYPVCIVESDTFNNISMVEHARVQTDVCIGDSCVWPGDANSDGIANSYDILNIGLAYDSTGPFRPAGHSFWLGQYATDWVGSFSGGVNHKHADCDGNGTVSSSDVLAITMNYGEQHFKNDEINSVGAPLLFDLPDSTFTGDTLQVPIVLGEELDSAENLYGIAFTIDYDNQLVDSSSFNLDFSNSWLGTELVDLIQVSKKYHHKGSVEIGLTRIDHLPITGAGELLAAEIIMIDDLSGKQTEYADVLFQISDVRAITESGAEIEISSGVDSLVLEDLVGIPALSSSSGVNLYPNPASDEIKLVSSRIMKAYTLRDLSGREIRQGQLNNKTGAIDIQYLTPGVYYIQVDCGSILLPIKFIKE